MALPAAANVRVPPDTALDSPGDDGSRAPRRRGRGGRRRRARSGRAVRPRVRRAGRRRPAPLFFCVRGAHADGHDFAAEALAAGAAALVVERPLEVSVPQVVVAGHARRDGARRGRVLRPPDRGAPGRRASPARTARRRPSLLLFAILAAAGRRPGLVGTIEARVGGERRGVKRTTPEAIDLQRLFREMLDAGDRSARDGGVVARVGAASPRPRALRSARLHEPESRAPRLPRGHGGLLPGEAAAVRRGHARRRRERRRRVRAPARGRAARRAHVRLRGGCGRSALQRSRAST